MVLFILSKKIVVENEVSHLNIRNRFPAIAIGL